MVRIHPENGWRALFVSEHFTTRSIGLPEDGSRALLQELFALSSRAELICRHQWQPHDRVFWNNRSVSDLAAVCADHQRHRLNRSAIAGSRPF